MSEEEKEAIEYWKSNIEFYHYNTQLASEHYAQILLNYIDKLQKENEEQFRQLCKLSIKLDMETISKDKIRAKIKELEKEMNREDIQEEHFWCVEAERSVLVELLEDN